MMIVRRISSTGNSSAKRLMGPDPIYPAAKFKAGISGSATVRVMIGIDGSVIDPSVVNASDADFGEAAIAAIKEWYFVPKVVVGKRVESHAEIPFLFQLPRP
jgi:TonB family protein